MIPVAREVTITASTKVLRGHVFIRSGMDRLILKVIALISQNIRFALTKFYRKIVLMPWKIQNGKSSIASFGLKGESQSQVHSGSAGIDVLSRDFSGLIRGRSGSALSVGIFKGEFLLIYRQVFQLLPGHKA